MSFHRTIIVAFAAVFTVAMTSLASACFIPSDLTDFVALHESPPGP